MYRTKIGRPLLGPWLKACLCPKLGLQQSKCGSIIALYTEINVYWGTKAFIDRIIPMPVDALVITLSIYDNLVPRAFPFLSLGRREKALAPGGHMTFNTQI